MIFIEVTDCLAHESSGYNGQCVAYLSRDPFLMTLAVTAVAWSLDRRIKVCISFATLAARSVQQQLVGWGSTTTTITTTTTTTKRISSNPSS